MTQTNYTTLATSQTLEGINKIINSYFYSDIEIKENTKLFDIGLCVLSNVTVDYAPNGWSTFIDGQPTQTRLTLQFKETSVITKSEVNAGY